MTSFDVVFQYKVFYCIKRSNAIYPTVIYQFKKVLKRAFQTLDKMNFPNISKTKSQKQTL